MSAVENAVNAWNAFVLDLDCSPKTEAELDASSLTWRRELFGQQWFQCYYHDTILNEALDATFEVAAVAKKFSRAEVLSMLVRLSFQIVFRSETDVRGVLKQGLDALISAQEQPFDVFAPVNGIEFCNYGAITVGAYSFLPAADANQIIVDSYKSLSNVSLKTDSVAMQDHVRVRVLAGDATKAREVAMFEFRWPEHAIKFFLKNDHCDFGITRFDQARLENFYVLTSDGGMAHFASSVRGSMLPLRIDELLHISPFGRDDICSAKPRLGKRGYGNGC